MDDISSFGPSGVVAVGLKDAEIEQLQEECAARRFRLVTASRRSDLPLSLQCDYAIVSTLLPDGDGRELAVDFARAGARVLLVNNMGTVSLFDAWSLGASTPAPSDSPADWLDDLARAEQIEAVSRAGRLLESLRLADAVESSAAFSGASGVPVCFVRISPTGADRTSVDEILDRLTSVVGMTTVFYDTPSGERMALVVNGDRRRLTKLLDDPELNAQVNSAVVEVSPEDDLSALIGRSLLRMHTEADEENRAKVLVALAPGNERMAETVRLALHRIDCSPLIWSPTFDFDDSRSNPPAAVIVEARRDGPVAALIDEAHAQRPPVPVLAVSDEEHMDDLERALQSGASDFLTWPFDAGDLQAALARVTVVGAAELEAALPAQPEPEADMTPTGTETEEDSKTETAPESVSDPAAQYDSQPAAEPETEPVAQSETEPAAEPETGPVTEPGTRPAVDKETVLESGPVLDPGSEDEDEPEAAEDFERVFARVLAERLASGESVTLSGLGVLSVRHETSRIVHDTHGRTIVEPPRRTLSFDRERPPEEEDRV